MAASPVYHDDMAGSELVISSLPLETWFPPFQLRQVGGFWFPEAILPGVAAAHARFEARPSDVFLASFPNSGTTWLKALAFAVVHRADHPPRSSGHPLRHRNPHDCVKFLEEPFAVDGGVLAALPSPRDALVSIWLFAKKMAAAAAARDGDDGKPPPTPFTVEEAFELFCDGRCMAGPQWRHVAGYWEASRRLLPDKVLFLRYEEMLQDPVGNVRKLAEFMGCAFSGEEEAAGVARDIVELCSIDALKNMEVNKNGTQEYVKNESFFRKGVAGDWSNHMTPAMAERLDKIVEDALQGTGFTFAVAQAQSA
ncbi:hypothetical protein ACQ4PT_022682 [Festuca glaucescens]